MRKVVVATTILASYKTAAEAVRAKCALKTIEAIIDKGYVCIVVDGGSSDEYVESMRLLGAQIYAQESPGMGSARRQALRQARDICPVDSVIVWTEPEKYPLIPCLDEPINKLIDGEYDLIMLRRLSLDSYPPEQAMAYRLIALATYYLTGIDSDFGWGPVVLSIEAVSYYLGYQSVHGDLWDSIHCPKLRIINDGLPWCIVPVDYHQPREQAIAETGMGFFMKRVQQVDQLVRAIEYEVDQLGMRLK